VLYNVLFLGAIGLFFIVFAERVIALFISDPTVVPIAVQALRFLSYGYVSYAYGMVVTAAFNGAGDTITPTALNIVCFWVCQIPLACVLSFHTPLGVRGSFVAIVVADSLLALLGVILFRRGRWKQRIV